MQPDWKDTHQLTDLRKLKLTDSDISTAIRTGRLIKLTAEVAIDKQYYDGLPTWKRAEARAAAVGISVDKAVVSGMAAGQLWGIKLLGVEEAVDLHLRVRGGRAAGPSGPPEPVIVRQCCRNRRFRRSEASE